MSDTGTWLAVLGGVAIVGGVAVLTRLRGRRRWPQLVVGAGVVLLLVGLLVRSSTPQPDPCTGPAASSKTCAVTTGNGSP